MVSPPPGWAWQLATLPTAPSSCPVPSPSPRHWPREAPGRAAPPAPQWPRAAALHYMRAPATRAVDSHGCRQRCGARLTSPQSRPAPPPLSRLSTCPPLSDTYELHVQERSGEREPIHPLNGQAAQTGFDVRQLGASRAPASVPTSGWIGGGHMGSHLCPVPEAPAQHPGVCGQAEGRDLRPRSWQPGRIWGATWEASCVVGVLPASSLRTSSLANSRNVLRLGVGPGKTLPRKPALGLGAEPPPPQAAGRDPGPLAGMEGAVQLLAVRPPTSCLC